MFVYIHTSPPDVEITWMGKDHNTHAEAISITHGPTQLFNYCFTNQGSHKANTKHLPGQGGEIERQNG